MWYTQDYRDRAASFRVGGLKKNACKIILCLIYFYSCKKVGGGAKAPQPLPLRGPWTRWKFFHILGEF